MSRHIGFIGLGNMGGRIARRIVAADIPVTGYDVRAETVRASGASVSETIAGVAAAADTVFLSLPDSTVIEKVVLDPDGLLEHVRPGTVVVDLSTAAPESTRRIHALMTDKSVSYLDAGISGGAAAAEAGTLTLMVGGDPQALSSVRWALEPFAEKVFHLGETGSGHVAKLLNNFLNAVALSATAEVMVAGRKAGLDLAVLLEVLNASSGVNFATLNRFPKMIRGDYLKGGLTNALMMKDVLLYQQLAAQLGVATLNAAGPIASFGAASALGYRDEISNTVVDAIGDLSGGIRIHEKEERE